MALSLVSLAVVDLRATGSSLVTASDASEDGGGVCKATGVTTFGLEACHTAIRGEQPQTHSEEHGVLVIELFETIGALRTAVDLLQVKVVGYVLVGSSKEAARVVESQWPSVQHEPDVSTFRSSTIQSLARTYSRTSLVLLAACPPNPNSDLSIEILRVQRELSVAFSWANIRTLVDMPQSIPATTRRSLSHGLNLLPYCVDSKGVSICRRPRLVWFDWVVNASEGLQVVPPASPDAADFGALYFTAEVDVSANLGPGHRLAGGPHQKLATFTLSHPKLQPHSQLPPARPCSSTALARWQEDRCRFPPYQYEPSQGVIHRRKGWQLPTVEHREVALGFPRQYTLQALPKSERKAQPLFLEDARLSLLGASSSVLLLALLLQPLFESLQLTSPKMYNKSSILHIQELHAPFLSFLFRPSWPTKPTSQATPADEKRLVDLLRHSVTSKGADLLLTAESENVPKFHRLRASIPARLWQWKSVASWRWRPGTKNVEHINKLELRAFLTALKWRIAKSKCCRTRFLHLLDSAVCLCAINKGRSSSRKLTPIMRQISTYCLAYGLSPLLAYVSTDTNPADRPSRRGQKRKRKWSS